MQSFVITQEGLREMDNFNKEILTSKEGNDASDLAAVRIAVQNGWSIVDAVKYLVGSPELKAAILIDSISNTESV